MLYKNYNITEIRLGYWDKDGCIPGIENATWISSGTEYQVSSKRKIHACFQTMKEAKDYIDKLKKNYKGK